MNDQQFKTAIELLRCAGGDLQTSAEHYESHGGRYCAESCSKLSGKIGRFLAEICACGPMRINPSCPVHGRGEKPQTWKDLAGRFENADDETKQALDDMGKQPEIDVVKVLIVSEEEPELKTPHDFEGQSGFPICRKCGCNMTNPQWPPSCDERLLKKPERDCYTREDIDDRIRDIANGFDNAMLPGVADHLRRRFLS